ncbi:hypothetical protein [Acidaminococcus timonensis]|uniref:hypothetical protein n=1 Tax=Acidaminococcus timonensis TaxID=1871002 RepID=UPI0008DA0C4E|nr:hypothetical protein [Acidaminococcus timonensis]
MSTIADLLIKIGADSSGLNSALKNAKGQIDKTFEPFPIKGFTDAINGTSASVEGFASKVAKAAALAGAGFGFTQLISGAVEAGSRIHDLTEAMGISAAEASMFSRTVAIAGGDIQTASTALMKLDKTLTGGGTAAEKAQIMLQAVGVSLQDSNGKLLPVNQQLEALAEGYQKAAKAGYQQEFIMNTLGAKGLALAGTLREYAEAKEQANKISGIGLDPEEMDRLSKELTTLKMQASSIGLATGAALAPIVEAYLPYLMTGLSNTAKFLAANKEEIVDITRNVVAFIAVYKTLQALQSASRAVGGLFGSAGSTAAEEALTRVQEKAIEKRIKMVQAAALAEEKAYYQSLATMQTTEAEKTALYAKFVKQRELQAAEEAAAIRNAMTAAYAQVNAAATESAAVQSAAGAKVAGQAAVTSAAIATTGTAATGAAVKTVGAATTSVTAIGTIKSAVWGLIGGWMGVAAAIGYATYKLFQYKQAQFNKEYYDDTVKYNGNTYKKVDGEWKLRGINDEEDEALGGGAYKYTDVTDEQTLQVLNDVEAARKAPKTRVNVSSGGGDGSGDSTAADLTAKLQEALNKVNAATATGSSGAGSSAAAAKAPEPKPVEVQVPIGQIAAQNAINAYNQAPGSQWLNPELTTDMNMSCAAFVGTMYAATGALKSFYTASGDNIEDQLEAKGAWHNPGDGYIPEAGDYISGPKHVGMYVGNGQVISRDSKGGLQQRDLASWKDEFGFIGFGSIREFTGGQTMSQSMLPDQQKQQEAIDRLNNAKAKAMELFTSMKDAIGKETGTAYESGMTSVTEDVRKKAQEIAQIQKDGVPADAIKMLTDELATYQTTMMDKVEKQRKENLDKLVTDTAKANAEVKGDYKSLADAEYQSTLDAINKERDERLKAVAKNKNDKEAMAAVEEWYTAQTAAAAQKRVDAYRESFDRQVEYAIKAHDMIQLQSILNSQEGKDSREWDGRTEAMERYYDLWKAANVSVDEQMTAVAEKAQTGLQDFFTNLFTGENSFTDSILDLFDSIMLEIVNQITEKWAAQIVTSLFGGFLGGNNGAQGGGLSIIGDVAMGGLLNISSIFGGGGNNGSGGSSGGIGVGDMGVGAVATGLNSLSTGLNSATTAVTAMGGATGTAGNLLGAYNVVQGVLNMTTKPAESATTVTTTAAMQALSAAALSASIALKSMSVGGSGFFFFASGGYISGPGTSTSDSIPAMLSNGEYVINADAVSRVGAPLLDAINQGRSIRHFASGGLVSGSGGSGIILKAGGTVQLNVSALDASSFVDFLRNGGGDTIKQLLLDNDRDYTGNTGVW